MQLRESLSIVIASQLTCDLNWTTTLFLEEIIYRVVSTTKLLLEEISVKLLIKKQPEINYPIVYLPPLQVN